MRDGKLLMLMLRAIIALSVLLTSLAADARFPRGGSTGATSFNGGKVQANPNFAGIGGDYPHVNYLKNSDGNWSYQDGQGQPDPTSVDAYGYPTSSGAAIVSHGGVLVPIRPPAQAYVGGNCVPTATGICFAYLVNGKGTVSPMPGTIITSGATGTVATGATTTITFSVPQDFRAGMEVPITGTNGTVSPNLTTGGATGAYTVCAAGLSATTIQLCLNDQTTALITTGSFTGFATVTYGRAAVGVTSKGRVVANLTGSPFTSNLGISAQDATTPITYRNGIDGLAMVMQGSEEVRYEQWRAGTCPGGYNPACQFGAANLAKMRQLNPGVIRHLNTVNPNSSLEAAWADRKSIGYYSNAAYIYDRAVSVWAGTTTSSGNDYAKTFGSGGPVDRQQIALSFDATSVTVTSGANALVTWTAHSLSTGSPFNFFAPPGSSVPGGTTAATVTYYAITSCGGSCDANHIRFATSPANAAAGTAVTTNTTGSNVQAHATVAITTAIIANSSSTITWNDPLIQVGDQVSITGIGSLGYPFNNGASYFVKTVSGVTSSKADITISATSGGTAITACGSCAGTFNTVKNPTFNLNSTGAIAIKDESGWGVGTVHTSQPMARTAGGNIQYGTLTYDAVLNVWLKVGADNASGVQFFVSGWPVETALEYCVTLGAHCWFSAPRYTFDGSTAISDYNPSLYAYVKATAPSWMIARFEPPNEFWNNGFAASNIGSAHAVVYAGTAGWTQNSGYHQAYGKAVSVLGQAANAAYSAPAWPFTGKYQFVAGVQTGNFIDSSGGSSNASRLSASDYVGQSTSPPTGYVKSAAYNWATHVAAAQYWSPGYRGTFVATALAAANAGGTITGSISGTTLTVGSVNVVTSPVFGIGSKLIQGPGVTTATVLSGTNPYTLDTNLGTIGSTDIGYVASGYDTNAVKTYLDSSLTSASFTGSTSGTTLTASSVTGFITNGMGSGGDLVFGTSVAANTQILAQLTGTGGAACPDVTCTGQAGTYQISQSQALGSRAMTTSSVFSQTAVNMEFINVFAFAQGNGTPGGWNGTNQLKMNGYEGGFSPDYTTVGVSLNDQLNVGAKLNTSTPLMVTGMKGWNANNLANFKAAGGEFPSMFQTTGLSPSNNVWSVLEDIYQPAPTPMWDAYKDYNFLLKRDLDPAANDNDPMWLEKAA